VGKDQLEMIAALRKTVSVEKDSLGAEVASLKASIADAHEKERLQTSQINKLLMDKIDLQSDGISQREQMLQSERNAACVINALADAS
jgi:protein HOOK3